MKIITGRFGEAVVFTKNIEQTAVDQIKELADDIYSKGSKIRVMPDVHAGAGNVIGLTMTLTDKIAPALIGPDIGCGVMLQEFTLDRELDLDQLQRIIEKKIPLGFNLRDIEHLSLAERRALDFITDKLRFRDYSIDRALGGLGTLGGGNHFIEVYKDDQRNNTYYLAVHTGSRILGGQMYNYYQSKAKVRQQQVDTSSLIRKLKSEGREREIQSTLEKIRIKEFVNKSEIKYLTGELYDDYLHDLKLVQIYAELNRLHIVQSILYSLERLAYDVYKGGVVDKPHNYVDIENGIVRKGAQSALPGERVLVPINMRDGMIIGTAKGYSEWNYSAPHGAGRVFSRSQAKLNLSLEEFRHQMKDIYSKTVSAETLDEAPGAYKNIEDIKENISVSIRIDKILKPIYNIKGGN